MKLKILFISHEASLTGAPKVLLCFMQWLAKHHGDKYDIGILHLKGGKLEGKFNEIAKNVYKIHPDIKSEFSKILNKLFKRRLKSKTFKQKVIKEIVNQDFDLLYANTALSLDIAIAIKDQSEKRPKLIAHIHELDTILKLSLQDKSIFRHVDKAIAVSKLVKENLITNWQVNETKIEVVYEFSDVGLIKKANSDTKGDFTVGGSGFVHWRKGYDLFIQVARYIDDNHPDLNIKFQWVGKVNIQEELILNEDLRKLNLLHKVKFLGEKENPVENYSNFDVFFMSSREDPFPLVCIEVGMLGKPIICFEQATGIQEVLSDGGGKIVPYLNVEKAAEAIIDYCINKDELEKDSLKAKAVFSNYTPEKQCPKIFKIINA
jgi:glycosyltransferase involved in cell wall biosynthesis